MKIVLNRAAKKNKKILEKYEQFVVLSAMALGVDFICTMAVTGNSETNNKRTEEARKRLVRCGHLKFAATAAC